MLRSVVAILIVGLVTVSHSLTARAQLQSWYDVKLRPSDARYRVLRTPHFEIIAEEGMEQEAREAATLLENQLPLVKARLGIDRRLAMPVVLNGYSDRGNGYVTAFPFKQEIEGVSLKGAVLSPRFPSWMWTVAPHELVHAAHAEAGSGLGVGSLVRWFSPDGARSLNLLMPGGAIEGAAVFHESRIWPDAGRLRHARFQMLFRAAIGSDAPWSLAQLLEEPAYTRPVSRFYIGGGNLHAYLAQHEDSTFFARALSLQHTFPFLGFGALLWHATGDAPGDLYHRFISTMQARERERMDRLGPLTKARLLAGERGLVHRNPRWLNDSTIVAYVSGYALRPGFYRYDIHTGARRPLSRQAITEDFHFSLNDDTTALYFSRYVPDPLVPERERADVFRLSLSTGEVERLTHHARVLAPVTVQGRLMGFMNDGQWNRLVQVDRDGRLEVCSPQERVIYVRLLPAPTGDRLAVLLNIRGHQGLMWADPNGSTLRLSPFLLFQEATIYSAGWSRDGRYLLFSADPGGVENLYAYEVMSDRVLRLTNVPYGALEPSLSPDGRTIAFINYKHERWDLALLPFRPDQAEVVPRTETRYWDAVPWRTWMAVQPETRFGDVPFRPYRAWRYLKPRMIYPVLRGDRSLWGEVQEHPRDSYLGPGLGVVVQSVDPLERWAYASEAYLQTGRLWGRILVESGRFVLRPSLSIYDLPSTRVLQVAGPDGASVARRVGLERRGASLGLRLPVVLDANVYTTMVAVSLRSTIEQERLFDRQGHALTAFEERVTLRPAVSLAYRLQANQRDLMPNSGMLLRSIVSVDLLRTARPARKAIQLTGDVYLPVSPERHTGLRLQAGMLMQDGADALASPYFLPRGYEDEWLRSGTFARLGLEVVQPVRYIDDGYVIVPLYMKAAYLYGFAETVQSVYATPDSVRLTAVGAGVGLQFRFFYVADLDLRVGAGFLVENRRWIITTR